MEDLNTVALVGRLTSDPELRAFPSGTSLCSMRLAFNTSQRNQATGEYDDKANFINVTVWGKHGETCAKYLKKGKRVVLKGRLDWREWGDPGSKRSEVSIVADRVQFLDPSDSTTSTQTGQESYSEIPVYTEVPF